MQPQRRFRLPLLLLALLWLSLPDPPLNILPPSTSAGKGRAAWRLLPGAHALVLSSSTLQSCVVDASTVRFLAWAVGISQALSCMACRQACMLIGALPALLLTNIGQYFLLMQCMDFML